MKKRKVREFGGTVAPTADELLTQVTVSAWSRAKQYGCTYSGTEVTHLYPSKITPGFINSVPQLLNWCAASHKGTSLVYLWIRFGNTLDSEMLYRRADRSFLHQQSKFICNWGNLSMNNWRSTLSEFEAAIWNSNMFHIKRHKSDTKIYTAYYTSSLYSGTFVA